MSLTSLENFMFSNLLHVFMLYSKRVSVALRAAVASSEARASASMGCL